MFQVSIPADRQIEAQWVCSILFGEFLGLDYVTVPSLKPGYSIHLNGKQLDLPDIFFAITAARWLKPVSLAALPLAYWDVAALHVPLVTEPLPVLFGVPGIELSESRVCCHVDIFGTVFYVLSRYEEIVKPDRDAHDRFPAAASLAHEAGFLYRPIVDEYAEMLFAMMKHLWPQLERKLKHGRVLVSCDVDSPFDCSVDSASKLCRTAIADIIKRRSIAEAAKRVRRYLCNKRSDYRFDPYHSFDWYMDACERHGHKVAFYFIPDHSAGAIDGCYDLSEPRVLSLIRKISERGHEVGMHGSYNTYQDGAQVMKERQRLMAACKRVGVDASVRGNRQHYLRWDAAQTPDHLDAAGFEYDTSGSFADMPGFRYGTSRSFTMWSWRYAAPLKIKQRPLVLMECSVMDEAYLGLGHTEKALHLMLLLKQRALSFGGDFTLLWHNSNLMTSKDREFFETLVG